MFVLIFLIATFIYLYILNKIKEYTLKTNKLLISYSLLLMLFGIYIVSTLSYYGIMVIINQEFTITIRLMYVVYLVLFVVICILKRLLFRFVPKKSQELYNITIAHRGFHLNYPENSLQSFKVIKGIFAIEMDVRFLKKDKQIVCFHDRYTKRLLGIPGKMSNKRFIDLRHTTYLNSNHYVTRLKTALNCINGKSKVLIEVKGYLSKAYKKELLRIINNYDGDVYFHCKNIITYFKLNKLYKDKVFWILNPFRKRFNFLKGHHYNNVLEFILKEKIEIPSLEDISEILVNAFEENETFEDICSLINRTINTYTSRINKDSFINNSHILHRGILNNKYKEHSEESFKACVRYAEEHNVNVTIELDLMYYKGNVICFHSDKASDKLGQEKSCANKDDINNSLKLEQIISILKGHEDKVGVIFDIKDFHFKNRILEKEIIKILDKTGYKGNFTVQSWNPFVLMYFEKHKPEYIRGQVGHSLSGLVKYVPLNGIPWIVNVAFFNLSHADYCVYDSSPFLYVLLKYNRIMGRPIYVYAFKSEKEINAFVGKSQISNFIVENISDDTMWSKQYRRKFKRNSV